MSFFLDSLFQLRDDGNPTRVAMFQCSGITNNTTRTFTFQDSDGTLALLSNHLGQFGATTSAQLAGVVSDETGSGALVFGTSPTITTSLDLLSDANSGNLFRIRDSGGNTRWALRGSSLSTVELDFYRGGSISATLQSDQANVFRVLSGSGNGTMLTLEETTASMTWADAASSGAVSFFNATPNGSRAALMSNLGLLSRLGVLATGTIFSNATSSVGVPGGLVEFRPTTDIVSTVVRMGATANGTNWINNAGSLVSFVDASGVFNGGVLGTAASVFRDSLFTITDQTDTSKTLKFELGSATTGADITLDYRSVTDRSLIFNMSGASGTAAYTLTFPQTTVARVATFPNATVTLAGLQIAQTFTRPQAIAPSTGTEALTLTYDQAVGTTDALVMTDAASGEFARIGSTYGGMTIAGNYSFYPFGGAVGSGSSGTIAAATLSASRVWTFPNFGGNVLVGGPTTQGTGQTASVPTNNLVTAAANPAASTWLINAYLAVTTAEAGTGTVSITIGWTDVGGARTSVIATRTLTTLGSTQGTLMIQSAASNAITFFTTYTPTAGGTTEAYAYYIQATKLG